MMFTYSTTNPGYGRWCTMLSFFVRTVGGYGTRCHRWEHDVLSGSVVFYRYYVPVRRYSEHIDRALGEFPMPVRS